MHRLILAVASCLVAIPVSSAKEPPLLIDEYQLSFSAPAPENAARDGNRIVAGAFEAGTERAYVMELVQGSWVQAAQLSLGVGIDPFFGRVVAISGDTIAVTGGFGIGVVYVFELTGGSWSLTATLSSPTGLVGEGYGNSLALEGNRLLVGAPSTTIGGAFQKGVVYIYEKTAGSWAPQSSLTTLVGGPGALFGTSVALDGDSLAIGAPGEGVPAGSKTGAIYVHKKVGLTWATQSRAVATDGLPGDLLGSSIDLDGDRVVAGARDADISGSAGVDHGAAYVFTPSGASWAQSQKLTAAVPFAGEYFGTSLAVEDDRIVVGGPYFDDAATIVTDGRIHAFVDAPSGWQLLSQLVASDQGFSTYAMGRTVDLDGPSVTTFGGALFGGTIIGFDTRFLPYGHGCPGAFGVTPSFHVNGNPVPGGVINAEITAGQPGATALILMGNYPTEAPAGFGCSLLVEPLLPVFIPLTLSPNGSLQLAGVLPIQTPLAPITLQAWLSDTTTLGGLSTTTGVRFAVTAP